MRTILLLPMVMIAGCSAVAVPPGTTDLTKMPTVTQSAALVKDYQVQPAGAKVRGPIKAVSCQRFQWDPEPTNETALVLLKSEAARVGANGVTAVSYAYSNISIGGNCFGNITAHGTAITTQ